MRVIVGIPERIVTKIALEVIVILLIVLFLATAADKWMDHETFRDGLRKSPFLIAYAGLLSHAFPWVENATMDTIYSITSRLITPAVTLNDRTLQVFTAIMDMKHSLASGLKTHLPITEPSLVVALLNFGGRNKEHRKSRLGLQLTYKQKRPFHGRKSHFRRAAGRSGQQESFN